jgi:hypothetical protein
MVAAQQAFPSCGHRTGMTLNFAIWQKAGRGPSQDNLQRSTISIQTALDHNFPHRPEATLNSWRIKLELFRFRARSSAAGTQENEGPVDRRFVIVCGVVRSPLDRAGALVRLWLADFGFGKNFKRPNQEVGLLARAPAPQDSCQQRDIPFPLRCGPVVSFGEEQ